jgi:hypothetical protein
MEKSFKTLEKMPCIDDLPKSTLPDLMGSPGQVSWARKIRVQFLMGADMYIKAMPPEVRTEARQRMTAWLIRHPHSSFWIDHRDKVGDLIKESFGKHDVICAQDILNQ